MLYLIEALMLAFNGTKNVPVIADTDGNLVVDSKAIIDLPIPFEDTSFLTGDSPATLDCNDALSRNATQFEIINDGPGNFTVALSNDGVAFSSQITVKQQEVFAMSNISIDTIRLTWVADSAYRVRVI